MEQIKSNITCTRCGKDILYCTCENSPKTRIEKLEKENDELKEKIEFYESECNRLSRECGRLDLDNSILKDNVAELKKELEDLKKSKGGIQLFKKAQIIQSLENKVTELKADNKTLISNEQNLNKELVKRQTKIERMKCCPNCKFHSVPPKKSDIKVCVECDNLNKWELKK